jgi:hypothetical protein
MFLTVKYRKPEVPLFPHGMLYSPFNILFRPSKLTEKGLRARKRCVLGFAGFFTCVALVIMIATLAP